MGPDCAIKGTDGGSGGTGGNGGDSGDFTGFTLRSNFGKKQTVVQHTGSVGAGGPKGYGKPGGERAYGGCGTQTKTGESGCRRNCYMYACCPPERGGCNTPGGGGGHGQPCDPNIAGINGNNGVDGKVIYSNSNQDNEQIIDKRWVLDFPYILQDMLLKYAVGLQNNDQSREAQEIYVFLQKFPGKIKRTADKLLSNMDQQGAMKPINEPVANGSFEEVNQKLSRRLSIGTALESVLNIMGQKFTFQTMFRDVVDTALDRSLKLLFFDR